MSTKLSWTAIKSYSLGFLLFFLAVIVADIYGGAGVTNLYYIGTVLVCLGSLPKCFARKVVPIELILLFIFIVFVEFRNGQWSLYYFYGLLQLLAVVLLATYLSTTGRIRYFVSALGLSLALACIYFLLFATNDVLKAIDSELRHALPFFSVSSAGFMTALGYLLGLVYYIATKNFKWLLLALISLAACLYTVSKNALLAIVLITVIYLFISKVIRLSRKSLLVIALIAVVALFAGGFLKPILKLYSEAFDTNNSYGIVSIAGRGSIWLFCLQAIPENPVFGYGYYSSGELLIARLGEEFTQAHNCLLHSLLSTGIIGTVLLAVYFVRVVVFVVRNYRIIMHFTHLRWILCMLMYFVIRSITEASFAQCLSLDVFWFFLLSLVMMNFANRRKKMVKMLKKRIKSNESPVSQSLPLS